MNTSAVQFHDDPELDLISNSPQIVWSPFDDSQEAAAVLLDMLREESKMSFEVRPKSS